jgi:hypothetical protein
MEILKRELKFVFFVLLGVAPMIVFLDAAMGIQLRRDYEFWQVIGFCICLVLYAEITAKVRR